MRQIQFAGLVELFKEGAVELIPGLVAETDKVEWGGRGEFKVGVGAYPSGELLGQRNMLANVVLQPLHPIMPDDEP